MAREQNGLLQARHVRGACARKTKSFSPKTRPLHELRAPRRWNGRLRNVLRSGEQSFCRIGCDFRVASAGAYLPANTNLDISLGKTFAEKYSLSFTVLNLTNERVELDNSLTFGGFHWNEPRQMYAEFRYRFHY